jgi:nicotinate-nucleotide pyrophosphorylase
MFETMKTAVELVAGRALLEASGGVNEENIVEIARTGVDFISCGAHNSLGCQPGYQFQDKLNFSSC